MAVDTPGIGSKAETSPESCLQTVSNSCERRFTKVTFPVGVVAATYFADGSRIACLLIDRTVGIVDATTGDVLKKIDCGWDKSMRAPIFSSIQVSHRGDRILCTTNENVAREIDMHSGKETFSVTGHSSKDPTSHLVMTAVYSNDGTHVLTASWDKTIRETEISTGRETLCLSGFTDRFRSAIYAPSSEKILSSSWDTTAREFTRSGVEIWSSPTAQTRIQTAVYSPDGTRLLVATMEGLIREFDAEPTKMEPHQKKERHSFYVFMGDQLNCTAYNSDATKILVTGSNGTVAEHDINTGLRMRLMRNHVHDGRVEDVFTGMYRPQGDHILTASSDKSIRVFDATLDTKLVTASFSNRVNSVKFSSSGDRFVTTCYDGTVRQFETATGQQLTLIEDHKGSTVATGVMFATYSLDDSRILSAGCDNNIREFDEATGRPTLVIKHHTGWVQSVAYSPTDGRILSASKDASVCEFSSIGKHMRNIGKHDKRVNSAIYSPSGDQIVTGGADHKVRVFDNATGNELKVLSDHRGPVNRLFYSPTGTHFISASSDSLIHEYDAKTLEQTQVVKHHGMRIEDALYSPDGQRIVGVSWDHTVTITDRKNGTLLKKLPLASKAAGFCIGIHPSGDALAVGTGDGPYGDEVLILNNLNAMLEDEVVPLSFLEFYGRSDAGDADPESHYRRAAAEMSTSKATAENTVFVCTHFFVRLAEEGRHNGLCKTYFHQHVDAASVPYNELLAAALESNSVKTIQLVLTNLALSISNRNDVVNGDGPPQLLYFDHFQDSGQIADLLATVGFTHPPLLKDFLVTCPLLRVKGNQDTAYISEHGRLLLPGPSVSSATTIWKESSLPQLQAPSHVKVAVSTETLVLPFNKLAGSSSRFLQALIDVEHEKLEYFSNTTVKTLLKYKWTAFGWRLFLNQVSLYATRLLFVTALALMKPPSAKFGDNPSVVVINGIVLLMTLHALIVEDARFILQYPNQHFMDVFSWAKLVNLVSSLSMSSLAVITLTSEDLDHVYYVTSSSIAAFSAWLLALHYMLPLPGIGPAVRMMITTLYEIRHIGLILIMILLGFSISLYPLMGTGLDGQNFQPFGDAVFTAYQLTFLSSFEPETFSENPGRYTWIALTLFVATSLLGPLVILNLIIAKMSDSYAQIMERDEEVKLRSIALLLYKQELSFSQSQAANMDWFPNWIHVLMRKGSNKPLVEKSAWNGTVGEIRTMFASQTQSMRTVLQRGNEPINETLPELQTKVRENTHMLAELMKRVTAMDENLAKVLQAVPPANYTADNSDSSNDFGFP